MINESTRVRKGDIKDFCNPKFVEKFFRKVNMTVRPKIRENERIRKLSYAKSIETILR